MRKKVYLSVMIAGSVFLTGCSNLQDTVEKEIINQTSVVEDADYQQYLQLQAEGSIDANGNYTLQDGTSFDINDPERGKVHVTLAKNSSISVNYYLDQNHEKPITDSECYINPGDCIYCDFPVLENLTSNMYRFSYFRVIAYDDKGNRKETDELGNVGDDNIVIQIPTDYQGTEIAVEPVGAYLNRTLYLDDYYVNSEGEKVDADGTWKINDITTRTQTVEVNPVTSYTVEYTLKNTGKLYCISASPNVFRMKEDAVIFRQAEPSADTQSINYTVIMHEWQNATFEYDSWLNSLAIGNDLPHVKSIDLTDCYTGETNEIGKLTRKIENLKYGDVLVITMEKGYSLKDDGIGSGFDKIEPTSDGGQRYTYTIPDTTAQIVLTITKGN